MTRTHLKTIQRMALVAGSLAAWGCQTDLPTGVRALATTSALSATVAEHETEPDPRIPPICHGYTATIWWNMPVEMIPKGATIAPYVPDVRPSSETAGALEDHDDGGGWGYRIVGTSGNDVIVGSPKKDRIFGQNGNDVICADPPQHSDLPDHESVVGVLEDGCGGGGSPGHGGGGPDRIWGGYGDDIIYGGGGPDTILAGWGNDTVYGGGGPDVIYGESGNDVLYGGPGPDWLFGGKDRDKLYGEVSNDWLFGEEGIDWLFGGTGRDVLDGGAGDNHLDSGDQSEEPDDGCGGHT